MPVQAESLEILEKAAVAPAQARAIVRAIEIELAGAKETLAGVPEKARAQQNLTYVQRGRHRALSALGAAGSAGIVL